MEIKNVNINQCGRSITNVKRQRGGSGFEVGVKWTGRLVH